MGMIGCLTMITEKNIDGLLKDPSELADFLYDEDNETNNCDLDKAWHAIHFLINSSVWGVTNVAGSVIIGGEPVSEEDMGYGPARFFTISQVEQISSELNKITTESLFSKYASMLEQGDEIYPSFQDTEEDREYISSYFQILKEFCFKAAREKQCLISYLG